MSASLPTSLLASAALVAAGMVAAPSLLDARAQEPARDQQPAGPHDETHEHSPLEVAMDGLKRGMRALRGGVEDPAQKGPMIEIVQAMQAASLDAFHHCPPPLKETDAVGTARWTTDFKKAQLSLCTALIDLELALAEGRTEDAKRIYGQLNDHKQKGHDTYDPE